MQQPTGLRTLPLEAQAPVDNKCEMAKRAYNTAHRFKVAFQLIVLALAVALAVAVAWAIVSFQDDSTTRGIFAVVASVASLLTSGVFGALAKGAREDADTLWARVAEECE